MNDYEYVSEVKGFLIGARHILTYEEIGSVFEDYRGTKD
jgi:hypothetical protein